MLKNKKILLPFLLITLLATLVACGAPAPEPGAQPPAPTPTMEVEPEPETGSQTESDGEGAGETEIESESNLPPIFAGQEWHWQAFEDSADGAESNDITVENPDRYTLELLPDGTYHLRADCNSGSGQYTIEGGSLTLEQGPMTLVACAPDSLHDQYLSLLSDVVTFVINDDGNLVLNLVMDAGNMIFIPAPVIERSLEDTLWVLQGIRDDLSVSSTMIDHEITATFSEGQLNGYAGCNSYFADYESDGESLQIGAIGSTKMACEELRNERESEFLAALQSVTAYHFERGALVLTDAEGNERIRMVVAEEANEIGASIAATPLTGVWHWQAFEDSATGDESNNIVVDNPEQYMLEIQADGTYLIRADCNSGSGQYTLEEGSLSLQPGPMTLAACGPDSLSDTFLSRLNHVATYVQTGENELILNLRADAGNMIFTRAQ